MSLKDLREAGVLLPQEEWGVHDLHSTVNKSALFLAGLLGLAAIAFMYLGNGHTFTFIGAGLFMAFMGWITYISLKAIEVQTVQFEQERDQLSEARAQAGSQSEDPSAGAAER